MYMYTSSESLHEFVCDFILISVHRPSGARLVYHAHACFHRHCNVLCPSDCTFAYLSLYVIFIKITIEYMYECGNIA